jgi:hypothetical protein
MKKLFASISILTTLSFLISACQQTGAGPRTWIDQPLDNSAFPLQKVILQAHASDDDGVDSVEFFLEDQSLILVDTGGKRMGQAMYEWLPPGEGEYTIYARSTDNNGNTGAAASSFIIIGDLVAQVIPPQPQAPVIESESEDEEEEEMIQVAEEPVEEPVVVSDQAINCRVGPNTAFEVGDVLNKDQPADVIGRLANNSWYLILHPESSLECWVAAAIVKKSGDFSNVPAKQPPALPEKPPAEKPKEEPKEEPEPEPETDTSPPIITNVQVNPLTIYQKGCAGDAQTAVISLDAIDLGGISTVEAVWSIGSESGSVTLTHVGGYKYQGTIGPINTKGTVSIYGSAVDNFGNWTPFTTTLIVDCCIC